MVNIFRHAPLSKSLKKVLAVDLVVDFNVDGTQNKKSLRRYENFFAALLGRFLYSRIHYTYKIICTFRGCSIGR